MGFFDRFGAGGGDLEVRLAAAQVMPGQALQGTVSFVGGKRAQQITHVKLGFAQTQHYVEQTPQGPQNRTRSNPVVPEVTVTGAFASAPGQRYEFPFSIQLPAQMMQTVPQQCTYRITVSADIDNEIDPGAGVDVQVLAMPGQMPMGQPMMGGMPGQVPMGQPMMGGMPGPMGVVAGMAGMAAPMVAGMAAPMMGGMPGQMPMGQPMMGGMPGQMPMGQPMMGGMPGQMPMGQPVMPMPANPMGVGARVIAQWQDGQYHPGVIVQLQNGYFAVDWENPQLGATTWVGPHQVQPAPQMAGMPMGMAPQMGQPMQQPMMAKQLDPKADPKAAAMHKSAFGVGSLVLAQGPDGNWHPARIVQQQNGYHAVDWDNPKLGASAWVGDAQLKPR